MKTARAEKKSPLKAKPLRNPGQSLDDQLLKLVLDVAVPWVFLSAFTVVWTVQEFVAWYFRWPRQPLGQLIVAVGTISIAAVKITKGKRQVELLKLGRDGEKAVGQYLERLREKGCRIFHDIQGDGFNVDHVIIGPQGVFTVETKTISKPVKGKPVVNVCNGMITVDGHVMDRDPIAQATAQAAWLKEVLQSSTGSCRQIKPVLVFPGWFVEGRTERGRNEVWVLNPKALPSFLDNEPALLQPNEVAILAHHLTMHIRSAE